jgi:hypothetical protein
MTGYTELAVTIFTDLPQLIDIRLQAFYIYQIFICLSSEPLMHFYFALDHVTELILSP